MIQFKGFKPEAMQRIAGTLGYQGNINGFNDYLLQNPDKMQQMNMYQNKAIQMVKGGMVKMQEGGVVDEPLIGVPPQQPTYQGESITELQARRALDPSLPYGTTVQPVGTQITPEQMVSPTSGQVVGDIQVGSLQAPTTIADQQVAKTATTYDVEKLKEKSEEDLAKTQAAIGIDPREIAAAQGVLPVEALPEGESFNKEYLEKAVSGTREVSSNEFVQFAKAGIIPQADAVQFEAPYQDAIAAKFNTQTPEAVAQDVYNLTPTQAAQQANTRVQNAAKLAEIPEAEAAQTSFQSTLQGAQGQIGANELANANDIIGTETAVTAIAATMDALNQQAVAQAAQATFSQTMLASAAQGTVDPAQTIQGQMNSLMEEFKNGTPTWAAGAMRAANAAMAARGLGGSSMAGAAIVQATMEAAIPIAAQDAQVYQQMGLANLNNRQQVSLANAAAQQNITLQNLNNRQQVALQNSVNAFALQSQSLSNQQAVVLANAQMKAALQNKTLDIRTQAVLTNAAKYSEMNKLNLSNTQQANLQRSAENLQINMQNLSNVQQTALSNLQVRASLKGQELSNEQQMAMLRSTQDFERANFDASAKQQAFLQDAQAQAALEGRAMDIRQQTQLFNVARIIEERGIELTNEQQTRLFNTTNRLQRDVTELSTRQQTALANVQIETTLRGQELNNAQQAAVLDAEKFAEANNLTFTSNQQVQLANSQLMQSIGMAELTTKQAATLQNAAQIASMEQQNLNARQQAAVQNAQNFLAVDMANLSNQQQVEMFKAQARQQALFTDQAAENASKQFNATSQNQTDQFFANLSTQTSQFNAAQTNAMSQFNAGEANTMERFAAEMMNQRDQFNAQNRLVIDQNNAQWRRQIATADTAAINRANELNATNLLNMSNTAYNDLWSYYQDSMEYAWNSAENERERIVELARTKLGIDAQADIAADRRDYESASAWGSLVATMFTTPLGGDTLLGKGLDFLGELI